MIRIKRFRNMMMTGKYCIVSGKVPTYVTDCDVVDADQGEELTLLETGFFESCTEADIEEMRRNGIPNPNSQEDPVRPFGMIIHQDDIDVSRAIDGQTPKISANLNLPRQKAILQAIENAGGVDKVDPKLRAMLDPEAVGMLQQEEPGDERDAVIATLRQELDEIKANQKPVPEVVKPEEVNDEVVA